MSDELYRSRAATYVARAEDNAMNALYERPALQALVGPVSGLRVLDAGCAGGGHSEWLVSQGCRVVGIDSSPEMVALFRKRLGHAATVHQADLARPLPFLKDGSFDLVLSSLTLHYVRDWAVPLGELHRVLRPGGRLVFSTHHPFFDLEASDSGLYRRTELVQERWKGFGKAPVTVRFYRRPLGAISAALADAGFTVRRMVEPEPSAELERRWPDVYTWLRRQPAFLLVDAVRD